MATDSSHAPWRQSTFDPRVPLRGGAARGGQQSSGHRGTGSNGSSVKASPSWGRGGPRGRWVSPTSSNSMRGGYGGASSGNVMVEALPPDRDIMEGLLPESGKEFKLRTDVNKDGEVKIQGCEYLGSYSWTNCEKPTVIVPGAPRHWLGRNPPYNVQPDVGVMFVDQTGYRMPKAPLVPLIAAVGRRLEDNPEVPTFEWSTADFVTDRNNLRKLLRWVRKEDKMKDFRMDLELAGEKTVLVNRWETKTREVFNGRTYGFNFEKASTEPAPGCQKGTGHHRIVTYDFGGLKMVVRFEVDACLPPTRNRKSTDSLDSINDLTDLIAAVDLASGTTTSTTSDANYGLNIIKGGYEVKSPTIMELTTRFEGRLADFDWNDKYPQLYFSQTPHHALAVHNRGRFSAIHRRKQTDPQFQELEKELQPHLQVLRNVLEDIQKAVVESGQRGRATLVCKDGVMKIYERESEDSCLPDHMMALFD